MRRHLLFGFNPCFNGINIQTVYLNYLPILFVFVSILVLMESTFRQKDLTLEKSGKGSFNPCFNGINIQTRKLQLVARQVSSFNPCFNGINIQTNLLLHVKI
mgnify:FL=1